MEMRFGTWSIISRYTAGVLGLVTSEIDRSRMDLVEVQEFRWEGSGTLELCNYILFYGEGHNEELHSLYRSRNIVIVIKSRGLRWAGNVARMEEVRSAFKILTGKPTGKRHLGRPRRRWKDNIRMDLEEIGINAGNWVDSAQDRNYWRALVNVALNLRVP